MRKGLCTLVLLACLPIAAPAEGAARIQPGDLMYSDVGDTRYICTLGFVVKDRRYTYFLTAAHCVTRRGQDIRRSDERVFGDVVVEGDPGEIQSIANDWALIRVRKAYVRSVSPKVRGIEASPTRYVTHRETEWHDLLRHSGHGVPWFAHGEMRENRYGELEDQTYSLWYSIGMDTNGDSGGPVVHARTNAALGLVSHACIGTCTSVGPTIQGILRRAAKKGYRVKLVTT